MAKFGVTKAYRFYADRFYLDRANRDTYLKRDSAGNIGISGNLGLPDLSTLDGVDLSVHAADIDAHMSDYGQHCKVARYLAGYPYGAVGTGALAADILYAMPFLVARAFTFDRIMAEVTSGGGAGKLFRLGVYDDDGTVYPNALKTAADLTAQDANTVAVYEVAITALSLTKGLYWVVIITNGTPTVRQVGAIPSSPLGLRETGLSASWSRLQVAQAYGNLPATFPAAATVNVSGIIIGLRVKSMD